MFIISYKNEDINIINGAVTGVQLGTPMQDATPSKVEDNQPHATERNTVTRASNSEKVLYTPNKTSVLSINGVTPDENGNVNLIPDYLQNNETAADYIKNRPFYTTDPVESELVNGTFAFVADHGLYMNQDIAFELTEGQTYKVSIDGVEYETVCQLSDSDLYIGSMELLTGKTPAYPFVYMPGGIPFFTNIAGDSHEVNIVALEKQHIKLPNYYLDDSLFLNPDYLQSDSSQPDYIKNRPCYLGRPSNISMDNVSHIFTAGSSYCRYSGEFSIQEEQDYAYVSGSITVSKDTSGTNAITTNINGYYPLVTPSNNRYIDIESVGKLYVFYESDSSYAYLSRIYDSNSSYYQNCLSFKGATDETIHYITANIEITLIKQLDSILFDITGKEADYLTLKSSTENSTKKFKITVDDSGALTATEVS